MQKFGQRPTSLQVRTEVDKQLAQRGAIRLLERQSLSRLAQLGAHVLIALAQIAADGLDALVLLAILIGQLLGQAVNFLLQSLGITLQGLKTLFVVTNLGTKDDVANAIHFLGSAGGGWLEWLLGHERFSSDKKMMGHQDDRYDDANAQVRSRGKL